MNQGEALLALPALPTERIAHLGGRRLLRCGISIQPMTAVGHKQTSRGPLAMSASHRERTSTDAPEMSAKCQKRTNAPQQIRAYSITLSARMRGSGTSQQRSLDDTAARMRADRR
jgi:hypothetical protein